MGDEGYRPGELTQLWCNRQKNGEKANFAHEAGKNKDNV